MRATILEADRVDGQHDQAAVGQSRAKRLPWVLCQTAHFTLAQVPLSMVLVMHQDSGEGAWPVWDQQECRDAV